jgi:hypothetical protein
MLVLLTEAPDAVRCCCFLLQLAASADIKGCRACGRLVVRQRLPQLGTLHEVLCWACADVLSCATDSL